MKSTQELIQEHKDAIVQLEKQAKVVIFKDYKIKVDFNQEQNGKKLSQIKIPQGKRLLRLEEIRPVFNYIKENKLNIYSFFEQPLKNTKDVAVFCAYSYGCGLICRMDSGNCNSALGVIFCEDLKDE